MPHCIERCLLRGHDPLLIFGTRSLDREVWMGLMTRFNLASKLNAAAFCAALVLVGAVVAGVI